MTNSSLTLKQKKNSPSDTKIWFDQVQGKYRQLSSDNEKLEMEILFARSAGLNGAETGLVQSDDDEEGTFYVDLISQFNHLNFNSLI